MGNAHPIIVREPNKTENLMPRYAEGIAERGSQRWLQYLVNVKPELINRDIAASVPGISAEDIHWLSPVRDDDYAEYRDRAFLRRLGLDLENVALSEFWPRGGPVWDGLARAGSHFFLLEAKAHIPELDTTRMKASQKSAEQIIRSLQKTKEFLGSGAQVDWAACFYQYANRIAHLHLLRNLNAVEAWLVNVYFVGDEEMGGPYSAEEWQGAIRLVRSHLGLSRHALHKFEISLFFDVREFELAP